MELLAKTAVIMQIRTDKQDLLFWQKHRALSNSFFVIPRDKCSFYIVEHLCFTTSSRRLTEYFTEEPQSCNDDLHPPRVTPRSVLWKMFSFSNCRTFTAFIPVYYSPHRKFHFVSLQQGLEARRQARQYSHRYSAPLSWLISLCSYNLFTTLANCHLSRGRERSPD